MEVEIEPRAKPLTYKVRATSRETLTQKAANILDSDLRSHWSTGTNTKEWILLELQEPCLLSHIRIYNKSVLEWEISAGLRYKPETFVKVRPRCEAPRREMLYPMNYTPCRYVRISCLRGNPISVFSIQLIGVSVASLEPEFQPVIDYLLPHIIAHKQDSNDMHLKLLEDITSRLQPFLPQLETDITNFMDDAESSIRFLSMLSGPFYPLLYIVVERENARTSSNGSDSEPSKTISGLTVSSNFEPRKLRNTSPNGIHSSSTIAFRADAVILLLKKANKDSNLRTVCSVAGNIIQKLVDPLDRRNVPMSVNCTTLSELDEISKLELSSNLTFADHSGLFGEEFQTIDITWDSSYLNILDIGAVEEGIFHILYATASQPPLCKKLADGTSDMWSALPLVQALLPALRPHVGSSHNIDDIFSLWKQPLVLQALSQIVQISSPMYRPLLHAASGYLLSFSQSHVRAACSLVDLCSGVLAPWMPQVTKKVDLAVELIEDLLGVFQDARHSFPRARAAVKYVVLALSGCMDDVIVKYKLAKHKILFLVEMLDPLLDPAIIPSSAASEFSAISSLHSEKANSSCDIALNIIRVAAQKSDVLPSLESEWRRGLVTPSVLLSLLDPHIQLPIELDKCKSPKSESTTLGTVSPSSKANCRDDSKVKLEINDSTVKMDVLDEVSLFFVPEELKYLRLDNPSDITELFSSISSDAREKHVLTKNVTNIIQNGSVMDTGPINHSILQADYLHLNNYLDCELRACEFRRLAVDLHSQNTVTLEAHNVAIDALLLAAECYVNPFFMMSSSTSLVNSDQLSSQKGSTHHKTNITELRKVFELKNVELLAQMERKRDRDVIQLLLEAAALDKMYKEQLTDGNDQSYSEHFDESIIDLSPRDLDSADAVTIVRQNQALVFNFLIRQFQRNQHPMHEILMQSLLFVLHSATKLLCAPESIIDIILNSAEHLNNMLTSFYDQLNEGTMQLKTTKFHEVQRRWVLLKKLVLISSANDQVSDTIHINNVSCHGNLFPPSAWIHRISSFSKCASPLVRYLGWMAVSRSARQYLKERLALTSDLAQLTNLLSIFSDDLALIENTVRVKDVLNAQSGSDKYPPDYSVKTFCVLYPDISKFFPQMKKDFESFGENILDSIGLKLRALPTTFIPDILCWFSDFCCCPFVQKEQLSDLTKTLKGYEAKNAKAIILYILEVVVVEHMEAIIPEIPKVMQVLLSVCRSSYADVFLLDSMLRLVRPIITVSLRKASVEENPWVDNSCLNFESLCFDELLSCIGCGSEIDSTPYKDHKTALMIYILSTVFPDLSLNRKKELIASLKHWADFASVETASHKHDYLSAFFVFMESCKTIWRRRLEGFGVSLNHLSPNSDVNHESVYSDFSTSGSVFLKDAGTTKMLDGGVFIQKSTHSSVDNVENLCQELEGLISILNPTLELSWKHHSDLVKKLAVVSSECIVLFKCLSSLVKKIGVEDSSLNLLDSGEIDKCIAHWSAGMKGLAEFIVSLSEIHCWEVASVMIDYLLGIPQFNLNDVVVPICSTLKVFSGKAPKIACRLQTDKWLSIIFSRGTQIFIEKESSLIDLFEYMLGHFEPEQRLVALKHLGGLVNKIGMDAICDNDFRSFSGPDEKVLTNIISSTWDQVIVLAKSDTLTLLRTRAMALLRDFVPFVDRNKLQAFLAAADNVLQGFGEPKYTACDSSLLQLSLALICNACLYSPFEDILLIPESVWKDIEALGTSNTGRELDDLQNKACRALCKLRNEDGGAKEILYEVLSGNTSKQSNPELQTTRESILQVLSNVTTVRSYYDLFSEKIDEETMEIEEAEMELELLYKITDRQESSENSKPHCHPTGPIGSDIRSGSRLQQIKETIRSLEKTKIKDEILMRRENKTLARQARLRRLEEAARREAELIQELDRERITEAEREIERQRALEAERAKTRELRLNIELEKEKQKQRELKQELNQIVSGQQSSRREYPSASGRPKDRFRDRDRGRSGDGNFQPESANSVPPTLSSGSRPFSGQPPTILPRDRALETGSNYEDNFEGSNYSGDTGSMGEPEPGSTFDGQTSGYGPSKRQSSRGSKSRQVSDKREKEGRRDEKWERKH